MQAVYIPCSVHFAAKKARKCRIINYMQAVYILCSVHFAVQNTASAGPACGQARARAAGLHATNSPHLLSNSNICAKRCGPGINYMQPPVGIRSVKNPFWTRKMQVIARN
jgi:hypothetical protein